MTVTRARDALVVIVDGDEVPGISIYGLGRRGAWGPVVFPVHVWFGEPAVDEFVLHGDAWEIPTWDLPILVWPTVDGMAAALRVSLAAIIESGCSVAWVGAEGLPFCDPPQLFDPGCMSRGVLAWMTADGQFGCGLDPDGPISPISDQQLTMLREYARGLADVD
ncbi:hypothetical protein EV649_8114 [Kribbella sp. VKM Ac-2569]|uniref:hypothetical protein n=1 Tax=Kribbella sp. VKM Ac-2569 TaxID=2512220 RepID=UPI00102D25FC|nr:hypothetical protein [Kribbella sp. VKM Ac-2569]RZT07407.1 hypothetical protein EV649_8114 [Kribbella sp. VKM Ac-2569]